MKIRHILLALLAILLIGGCLKDDTIAPKNDEVINTVIVDTTYNLEGIDLTTIKDFSRSGIINAPLFHVPTLSVSHTLLGVSKHEWFTKNGLDSIRMVKTSSGTAVLNNTTEIANYKIVLYYRDGTSIILDNHLAKYIGENVKVLPTAVTAPLMNITTTQKRVIAERTSVSPKSVKHIYRPQTTYTSYPWRFSIDGVFSHQDYMQPVNPNSTTWYPNHII